MYKMTKQEKALAKADYEAICAAHSISKPSDAQTITIIDRYRKSFEVEISVIKVKLPSGGYVSITNTPENWNHIIKEFKKLASDLPAFKLAKNAGFCAENHPNYAGYAQIRQAEYDRKKATQEAEIRRGYFQRGLEDCVNAFTRSCFSHEVRSYVEALAWKILAWFDDGLVDLKNAAKSTGVYQAAQALMACYFEFDGVGINYEIPA